MVAILQFELRVTTFPERRLCGVCLDRQRWTPISGLTFATSGKPASLFLRIVCSQRLRCREAIAVQPAKRLLYSEEGILRCRKEILPHAFVVAELCPLRHLECGTAVHQEQFYPNAPPPSARSGNRHVPNRRMHGFGTFIVRPYPFG
jgi:hypothetical protein